MAACLNWSRVTFNKLQGRQCIQTMPKRLSMQKTTKATPNKSKMSLQCTNELHEACWAGSLATVQRILSLGQDINCRGRFGQTLVMLAAALRHVAVFDFLVSQGCDMLSVDKRNNTVLHYACMGGNIDIIRNILDHDKSQLEHRGRNEMTPVMIAARFCKKDVIHFLRRKHCNLSVVNGLGETILLLACRYGCTDVADYVLSDGTQGIESRGRMGWTPLLTAASCCKRKVFDFLITKGSNVTAVDNHGQNILHLASQSGCTVVADYILSEDLINRESMDRNGHTPLWFAAYFGRTEMVTFLLSKGCSLKAVDRNYDNILHVACTRGHIDMLKYLLTLKEVDWYKKNGDGKTPVEIAEGRNMKAVVDLLKARLQT